MFRKLDIWDANWKKMAKHFNIELVAIHSDPRNFIDKTIHAWLKSGMYKSSSLLNNFFWKLFKISRW